MNSYILFIFPLTVWILLSLILHLCINQEILIQDSNKELSSCIRSIITHWFKKGSSITYVDIDSFDNEIIKAVHEMIYLSVILQTTKTKVVHENEGYLITAKDLRGLKNIFMFLSMEEGWDPDEYFLIIFKELEFSQLSDVFKILLHYHVFKVLVINGTSSADIYTYNPFENYGCGIVFTRTISYGKCLEANISKTFFYKPITGLRKCTFKAAFRDADPYVIDPNNDHRKVKVIGIEQFVLQTLSELEQFDVIYTHKFNSEKFYAIRDLKTSGPFSFLHKGDVDILIGKMLLIDNRAEAFSYLYGYHYNNDGLIILVKKAGLVSNLKNIYLEFDAVVWILLGVAFILFFVVSVVLFHIKDKCRTILVMWDVLLHHGATLGNKLKFRYFICIWIVFAFLISIHYQTNLSSRTTYPTYEYQISNQKDLTTFDIKPCVSPPVRKYLLVVSELDIEEGNSEECETMLQSVRTISRDYDKYTIVPYSLYNNYKLTFIDEYGNPQLYAFKQPISKILPAIFLYKGFPMLRKLQLKVLHIIESGLFNKHLRDLLNEDTKKQYFPETHFRARLIIPWHILVFGLSLATGCFATEIIMYYIKQKIRNKVFVFVN